MNLNKIRKQINQPYPYTGSYSDSVKTIFLISLFVFLFVLLFRSDHFTQDGALETRILISSCFGLTTFLAASTNTILFNLFFPIENGQNWKVKNEIIMYICHFVSISGFNLVLVVFVFNYIEDFSFWSVIFSMISTLVVGIIPVSIHVIQQQKKLYKNNYDLATKLNESTINPLSNVTSSSIVINNYLVVLDDLLFAESQKNYVCLTINNQETIKIRLTLKSLEKMLENHSNFMRCHRAFIINSDKISKVEGNAQGLKLHLHETNHIIPVSRSYIPRVTGRIRHS